MKVQEFLQEWEKKNNPLYPNEMKWDRLTVNLFAKDFDEESNRLGNRVSDDLVREVEEKFIYAINGISKEPRKSRPSYYINYLRALFDQGQAMELPLETILKHCCVGLTKIINDHQAEKIQQALNSR